MTFRTNEEQWEDYCCRRERIDLPVDSKKFSIIHDKLHEMEYTVIPNGSDLSADLNLLTGEIIYRMTTGSIPEVRIEEKEFMSLKDFCERIMG